MPRAADLTDYDDDYLACRDLRHAWRVLGYFKGQDSFGTVVRRRLRCDRCHTLRTDTLSGLLPKRSYTYDDDYHLPGVKGPEIRNEVLERASVSIYASEEDLDADVTSTGRKRRKR